MVVEKIVTTRHKLSMVEQIVRLSSQHLCLNPTILNMGTYIFLFSLNWQLHWYFVVSNGICIVIVLYQHTINLILCIVQRKDSNIILTYDIQMSVISCNDRSQAYGFCKLSQYVPWCYKSLDTVETTYTATNRKIIFRRYASILHYFF